MRLQHAADDAGDAFPVLGLGFELRSSGFGNRVELCLAVVLGCPPLGGDPALLQEPHEAQINRPLIDDDRLLADLLDPTSDAVAVQRTHLLQRLEDHEIERALEDGRPRFHMCTPLWDG